MTSGHKANTERRTPRVVALILTHAPPSSLAGAGAGRKPSLEEAMLGWVMSSDSVDAAVPGDVQRIVANTLCRMGRVTFLDSTVDFAPGSPWRAVLGGAARVLAPTRFQALIQRPAFPLRYTSDPELTQQLFDDPAFPWLQGGQLALVSPPEAAPLDLDYSLIDAAFDPNRVEEVFGAMKDALLVLMRPGPDGDFAHFAVRNEVAALLWERLSESCVEMSIPLRVVDGPEFSRIGWTVQED